MTATVTVPDTHAAIIGTPEVSLASDSEVIVTGKTFEIQQTPTISTSPNYTAGDCLGGLLTFANAARTSGGGGTVQGIGITNLDGGLTPQMRIYFARETFTSSGDNSAWDPSDSDLAKMIAWVDLLSCNWAALTDNSFLYYPCYVPFKLTGTSLFAQLTFEDATGDAFTSTSDLEITLTGSQD